MNYRGIIIEQSLINKNILTNVKVLSKKIINERTTEVWNMLKVEIPEEKIEEFIKRLAKVIKPHEPWYAHFYHEDPRKTNMIVVFSKEIILITKNKPEKAVEYGLRIGIPLAQLDFKPNDILKETW